MVSSRPLEFGIRGFYFLLNPKFYETRREQMPWMSRCVLPPENFGHIIPNEIGFQAEHNSSKDVKVKVLQFMF